MKGIIENFADLSDSKEVMESKPVPFTIWFIYIIFALLTVSLLWAYFSEMDIVVKAEGVVRPDSGISTLTSKVTGKLNEIHFQNGDYIKKGDLIYVIDHEALLIQKQSLENDLIKATRDQKLTETFIRSVHEHQNLFDPINESDYYREYAKYEMDTLQTHESIKGLDEKINHLEKAVTGYEKILSSIEEKQNLFESKDEYALKYQDYLYTLENLNAQLTISRTNFEAMTALYSSGSLSEQALKTAKDAMLSAQNAIDQYENEALLNLKTNLETTKSNLSDYKMELVKLTPENQTSSGTTYYETNQLILLNNQLNTYNKQISTLSDNLEGVLLSIENASIKSPVDGVLNIEQNYVIGDLMTAGSKLATVIPSGESAFKIQLYVPNRDISQISIGDPVKFKFHALPYKEYGSLEGKISQINADATFNPDTGASYYLIEADVENKPLVSYKGNEESIKVGMSLNGQVITKRKKILYYLLEKIDLWG